MKTWINLLVVFALLASTVAFSPVTAQAQAEEPPTPTVTATPEEPTATPTETLVPTETPTPTETLIPTETLTPTETALPPELPLPTETPIPPTDGWIELTTQPTVLPRSGKTNLIWNFTQEITPSAELLLTLPPELTPFDPTGLIYDPALNQLTYPASAGEVRLQAASEIAAAELIIHAALRMDGSLIAELDYPITVVPAYFVSREGGQITALEGAVTVAVPAGALAEDASFTINPLVGPDTHPAPSSEIVFEINATGSETDQAITQFNTPISITASYNENTLWGDESSLALMYYDETISEWRYLPSSVDTENNTVTALSDHLTVFSFNIQDWQAGRLPSLDGATTSLFTGAATYSTSFWTPPAPGGWQPSLSLSYSSEVVDSADSQTQASWVGMGWSLDTGYIERNQNGTKGYQADDTFLLTLNGASYMLIERADDPDNNPSTVDYRTRDESFMLIRRTLARSGANNRYDASSWLVKDKSGNSYTFDDRAQYPMLGCDAPLVETWRWSLTQAQSGAAPGNIITYAYAHETVYKNDCAEPNSPNFATDRAVYPLYITYPHEKYRITFVRASTRTDYLQSWEDNNYLVLYQRERLTEILIEQDTNNTPESYETVIRRYKFTYSDGIIFPGLNWGAGTADTPALISVQEFDGPDPSDNHLPATSFEYGDSMHLTQVNNGYNGSVRFTYEATPWTYTEGPRTYLGRYGRTYNCKNETFSVPFPGGRFYPGGVVRFKANVNADPSGAYHIGIEGAWNSPIWAAENVGTATFQLPIGSYRAALLVAGYGYDDNDDDICYVGSEEYTYLPTHYRVMYKDLFVGGTQISRSTYSYTGAAVNDSAHSATAANCPLPNVWADNYAELEANYMCYTRTNGQFRGHAQVTETRSDGTQTITKFYQDDVRYGRPYEVLVKDNNGQTLSQTLSTYTTTLLSTSPTYPCNNNGRFIDVQSYWIRQTEQQSFLYDTAGNKIGTKTEYQYAIDGQGNPVYGNLTHQIESEWNGSAFDFYRDTVTYYYPNSGTYRVGLPGAQNVYRCDAGGCVNNNAHLMSSQWYLYDNNTAYNQTPTNGVLAGTRTLLRFTDPINFTGPMYSDQKFTYDNWGNQTTVTVYPNEAAANADYKLGVDPRTTTTTYDDAYHTYASQVVNANNQSITYDYNYSLGLPITEKITGLNDTTVSADYDGFGRLTQLVRPGDSSSSPTVQITYYDYAVPYYVEATQKIDATTSYVSRKFYDGLGRQIQSQVVGAVLSTGTQTIVANTMYAYDQENDQQITQYVPYAVSDCGGYCIPDTTKAKTETTSDALGRVVLVKHTDGTTDTYAYTIDLTSLPVPVFQTSHTDQEGNTSTSATNIWGQVVQTNDQGLTVAYEYDPLNRLTQATYANNNPTLITYDLAGRKLTLDDPDMGDWTYGYDALGNLTSQTDARSCTTTLVYDSLNRVTDKIYGTGCPTTSAVSYTYDAGTYGLGQRTGMTDGSGSTSWTYDERGRVILETRSITDSAMDMGDFTTQWTYNSADQIVTIQYPSDNAGGQGEIVTYTYLPQMALDTVIGTNTYVSDTQYDYAGRITTRILSSSSFRQNYTYVGWSSIGSGRLDTLKTGTNSGYYNNLQNLDYNYDAVGNITSIKNFRNSNQVQCFGYDSMDRLVSGFTASSTSCQQYATVGNGAYQESYSYESTTGNLSSKVGADYEYAAEHPHAVQQIVDEDNQVNTAITVRARGVYNVSWPTMKLYVNGELRQTWTVNSTTYTNYTVTTPAGANAIIEVRRETPTQIGGSTSGSLYVDYVTVGGVTRQSEGGAAFLDWGRGTSAVDWQNVVMGQESINSDGALRFAFGPQAFAGHYDANGNLTHRLVNNAATIMSYDAENRLVQVSGATTATFVYNGDGERVRSTVNGTSTAFIGSILEWTGSTTTMIRYYYAGAARIAMRSGTDDPHQYILSDHLGSTSVTTSSEGVYQSGMLYKPWGETRWTSGTLPTKYTYTSQYSNVTDFGLMYYNARYYDPLTSRFSQADSIVPQPGDPQSWDRYAYVNNSPINNADPTGHWIESVLDIAFIAYDIYDISTNGWNWENGLSLAADVASLVVPAVTGGGLAVRAVMHVDDAIKAVNTVDTVVDITNTIDNTVDVANAMDNAIDVANSTDNLVDAGKPPFERHHSATNKNKIFTPQLEAIAEKYGLDLDDIWNIQIMPHKGRHPNKYHEWVLKQMQDIDDILGNCGANCGEAFKEIFIEKVVNPVMRNSDMLRKKFWLPE